MNVSKSVKVSIKLKVNGETRLLIFNLLMKIFTQPMNGDSRLE